MGKAKEAEEESLLLKHSGGDAPERERTCDRFFLLDPRRWPHRYTMLFFMCMLSFGSYYCFDNPVALQRQFISVMDINMQRYALMYSLYSWPNVILSFFGGLLIDRVFGIRVGTIVFSVLVCVGQLIFAFGGVLDRYWLMLVGRFVFGLGGESLAVAQNAYAVLWFKEKELNMVFGLLLSISRVGSTLNQNINSKLYNSLSSIPQDYVRLGFLLLIGFGICVFSLVCAVVLGLFDKRAERILQRKKKGSDERISLRDIKDFPLSLWLVFIICVAYYVSIFPFIGLAIIFLEEKYSLAPARANIVNSLVYLISAGASPVLGFLVDKTGMNLFWLNLGVIATLGAHAMLGFLNMSLIPYVSMSLMGVSYSLLACALWPLVSFIVPEHQLGTAYGIMQSIQNLGLAVATIVAGAIIDQQGYLVLEVFFCAMLSLALISGALLYLLDSAQGGKLNQTAWARARARKIADLQQLRESEDQKAVPAVGSGDKVPYNSPIVPSSAFHIRNRFLSRVGTKIPEHVLSFNPMTSSYAPHVGVVK